MPDKRRVLDALIAQVRTLLAELEAAAEATRLAATHEEARPENDKDTRGLEASYLARGQAERVETLHATLARLSRLEATPLGEDDAIAVGALVRLDTETGPQHWLVAPDGGGLSVVVDGIEIKVVTLASPAGRAAAGKRAGDGFEVRVRNQLRAYEIVELA
jgi:transcription elongation GreA/GreB family factor